ncbi:transporter substrate-binding domain-containing protein [Acuticoccus yangtzensis]|uniref:transporter substrate-binding domain-containing protein n=1 Tax=Acuticoccus yangtzensis TaxID=1443441 RepID=UPI000949779A|nr:transporter substrate-binding domain-containing protein [Acuticoccus yangtzensis]
MRIVFAGLTALTLLAAQATHAPAFAQDAGADSASGLSEDAAIGAAGLGLTDPPAHSDRNMTFDADGRPVAAPEAGEVSSPSAGEAAAPLPQTATGDAAAPAAATDNAPQNAEPSAAAQNPAPEGQTAESATPASEAADAAASAPAPAAAQAPAAAPGGEADASPEGAVETGAPAETSTSADVAAPSAETAAPAAATADAVTAAEVATDAADATVEGAPVTPVTEEPSAPAAAGATDDVDTAEVDADVEDIVDEDDDAAAIAAGALGLTSPPDNAAGAESSTAGDAASASATADPQDESTAATAAGALGLTTPPESSGATTGISADSAATAAGALGIPVEAAAAAPAQAAAAGSSTPINVAILDDAAPFSFAGRFGVRSGFDVDLVNALCRTMKANCQIMPMAAEDIIQALLDRRVAFAVATPAIAAQAGSPIAYSAPYLSLSVRFVTPRSARRDAEDGRAVYGALAGTPQASFLEKTYPEPKEVRLYPHNEGMWIDLVLGRLDGVLAAAITARREFLSTPLGRRFGFSSTITQGEDQLARPAAIGVRPQDSDLLDAINAALAKLRADGDFDAILARNLDRDLVTAVSAPAP